MKGIILAALIMLGASTTINSTTYSGYNWDHPMGNYMGSYSIHTVSYKYPGSEDWIIIMIECYPSNRVCFNINGQTLEVGDYYDSQEELLDYEGDPDQYTISGTR